MAMDKQEIIEFVQGMFPRTDIRESEGGGILCRFRNSSYSNSTAQKVLVSVARAAGYEVAEGGDLVRLNGEASREIDPRRITLEGGYRFEITSDLYQHAMIFDGVDLRESDLTSLCVSSPYGSSPNRRRFAADLRGARPLEALMCTQVSMELGRFDVRALDLARSQFDDEQVERIVAMCVEAPKDGLLDIVRNPACTVGQAARVIAAFAALPDEPFDWRSHVVLFGAAEVPEAFVEALPDAYVDIALKDAGLNPSVRDALVARRMAHAHEMWRHLAPGSVAVTPLAYGTPEPQSDKLCGSTIGYGGFPRDAFAGEWEGLERADRYTLEVYLDPQGELEARIVAYTEEDLGGEVGTFTAVVNDPAALFAEWLPALVKERLRQQDDEILRLREEYLRKIAQAEALRDRLRVHAGR